MIACNSAGVWSFSDCSQKSKPAWVPRPGMDGGAMASTKAFWNSLALAMKRRITASEDSSGVVRLSKSFSWIQNVP